MTVGVVEIRQHNHDHAKIVLPVTSKVQNK